MSITFSTVEQIYGLSHRLCLCVCVCACIKTASGLEYLASTGECSVIAAIQLDYALVCYD